MLKEVLIADFKAESAITKKLLDRMPESQLDFKPHEKSASIVRLASHIAALPQFIPIMLNSDELNFAGFKSALTPPQTKSEVLENFKMMEQKTLEALEATTDEKLLGKFKVVFGEHVLSEKIVLTKFNPCFDT